MFGAFEDGRFIVFALCKVCDRRLLIPDSEDSDLSAASAYLKWLDIPCPGCGSTPRSMGWK